MDNKLIEVVTVTPNPAIDQTLTIPNLVAGSVNRVEQQRAQAGGKGVNVAAALADYGHAVAVTGFLGRDNASTFEALFSSKNIADGFIRIAGATRVGIKIHDPLQQQTTDINFPGQPPAPDDVEQLLHHLKTVAATSQPWFVLAGSLPPGIEPAMYRDLTSALKNLGCRVLLDTSGEALRLALAAGPNIIKPNIHELEALLGAQLPTPRAIVAAARSLLAAGVELVVVSMGAEGALFVSHERAILARPPEAQIRSSVGAGDAMVAGILAAQLGGLALRQTARLASAFALAALTRAESEIASRAKIDALVERITIDELGEERAIL